MKHHFKFALGNLKRYLFTSALNLIGLTTAFAAFVLIMLYVKSSQSYEI